MFWPSSSVILDSLLQYQTLSFCSYGYESSEYKAIGRSDSLILPFVTIAALLWCSLELSK